MLSRQVLGLVVVSGFLGACAAPTKAVDKSRNADTSSSSDDAFVVSVLQAADTPVLVSAVVGRGVTSTRTAKIDLQTSSGGLIAHVIHEGTVSSEDGQETFGSVSDDDFDRLQQILTDNGATVFDPPTPSCCDIPARHQVTAIVRCTGEDDTAECTYTPFVSDDDFMSAILEKSGVPALVSAVVGRGVSTTRTARVEIDTTTGGLFGRTRTRGKIESEDGTQSYGAIDKDSLARVRSLLEDNGAVASDPPEPPCCDRSSTSTLTAVVSCTGAGPAATCTYATDDAATP
jgi:hypothetical protein